MSCNSVSPAFGFHHNTIAMDSGKDYSLQQSSSGLGKLSLLCGRENTSQARSTKRQQPKVSSSPKHIVQVAYSSTAVVHLGSRRSTAWFLRVQRCLRACWPAAVVMLGIKSTSRAGSQILRILHCPWPPAEGEHQVRSRWNGWRRLMDSQSIINRAYRRLCYESHDTHGQERRPPVQRT